MSWTFKVESAVVSPRSPLRAQHSATKRPEARIAPASVRTRCTRAAVRNVCGRLAKVNFFCSSGARHDERPRDFVREGVRLGAGLYTLDSSEHSMKKKSVQVQTADSLAPRADVTVTLRSQRAQGPRAAPGQGQDGPGPGVPRRAEACVACQGARPPGPSRAKSPLTSGPPAHHCSRSSRDSNAATLSSVSLTRWERAGALVPRLKRTFVRELTEFRGGSMCSRRGGQELGQTGPSALLWQERTETRCAG